MWNDLQLKQYHDQGFLACPGLFTRDELSGLIDTANEQVTRFQGMPELTGDDEHGVHYVREHGGAVRSLFAMHNHIEAYRRALRHPDIVGPIKQIFDQDAYVYHSKLNVKDAFEGSVWLWHQDFGYWQHDGVNDRLTSVLIMLDETTLHGGCMLFVPGSHRWGVLDHASDEHTTSYKQWCVTVPALKAHLKDSHNIVPVVGQPGDVYFFDCKTLHASGHNLSPQQRKSLIFACAAADNQPGPVENPRPAWVVDRTFELFTK